jgi:hypothetical protein
LVDAVTILDGVGKIVGFAEVGIILGFALGSIVDTVIGLTLGLTLGQALRIIVGTVLGLALRNVVGAVLVIGPITGSCVGKNVISLNIDKVGTRVGGGVLLCETGALEKIAQLKGIIVGDDIGVNDGVNVGLTVGLLVGLVVGFTVGLVVGFTVPFAVGFVLGLVVCLTVGLAVPFAVGFVLGLVVCLTVGLAVPFTVPFTIGLTVGLDVPFATGLLLGIKVGTALCIVVVCIVGLGDFTAGLGLRPRTRIGALVTISSFVLVLEVGLLLGLIVGLRVLIGTTTSSVIGFTRRLGVLIITSSFEIGLFVLNRGLFGADLFCNGVFCTDCFGVWRLGIGLLRMGCVGTALPSSLETGGFVATLVSSLETGAFVLTDRSSFDAGREASSLPVGEDPVVGLNLGFDFVILLTELGLDLVRGIELAFDPRFARAFGFGLDFLRGIEDLPIDGFGLEFTVDPRKCFVLVLVLVLVQLLPPTFFFNQSRPLFTALSAICLVTLFTLLASVSKILVQGSLPVFGKLGFNLLFIFLAKVVDLVLIASTLALIGAILAPTLDLMEPIFAFILETAPFFLPLQKLLNPFFKHCIPFRIAICLAFAAAAFFNPATPPVFAIAATFNPTRIILPMRLNLFSSRG